MAAVKKTATTRRTAKTIRNLRGTPVHLRLFGGGGEKPYRIELQPRGKYGDVHSVPANLTDDGTFVAGVGVLFEVITKTEADKIQYGAAAPAGLPPAKLIREEETVIRRVADVDDSPRGVRPKLVDVPGANAELHQQLADGENAALPANAFPKAKLERA